MPAMPKANHTPICSPLPTSPLGASVFPGRQDRHQWRTQYVIMTSSGVCVNNSQTAFSFRDFSTPPLFSSHFSPLLYNECARINISFVGTVRACVLIIQLSSAARREKGDACSRFNVCFLPLSPCLCFLHFTHMATHSSLSCMLLSPVLRTACTACLYSQLLKSSFSSLLLPAIYSLFSFSLPTPTPTLPSSPRPSSRHQHVMFFPARPAAQKQPHSRLP